MAAQGSRSRGTLAFTGKMIFLPPPAPQGRPGDLALPQAALPGDTAVGMPPFTSASTTGHAGPWGPSRGWAAPMGAGGQGLAQLPGVSHHVPLAAAPAHTCPERVCAVSCRHSLGFSFIFSFLPPSEGNQPPLFCQPWLSRPDGSLGAPPALGAACVCLQTLGCLSLQCPRGREFVCPCEETGVSLPW